MLVKRYYATLRYKKGEHTNGAEKGVRNNTSVLRIIKTKERIQNRQGKTKKEAALQIRKRILVILQKSLGGNLSKFDVTRVR